jgi:hypothetical protein
MGSAFSSIWKDCVLGEPGRVVTPERAELWCECEEIISGRSSWEASRGLSGYTEGRRAESGKEIRLDARELGGVFWSLTIAKV